jgi:uncharacterized membrane protein YeaQ/YmgE (transglycosylase-associated protein family)
MGITHILWIILIGFVAGTLARWFSPAPNNPQGFILTVVLGIVGAFVATFIGQKIGWYREDQGAGFITATLGAIIVLAVWRIIASQIWPSVGGDGPAASGPRRWL